MKILLIFIQREKLSKISVERQYNRNTKIGIFMKIHSADIIEKKYEDHLKKIHDFYLTESAMY